ncbi:MAG: ChpI protein [Acidobacteria bacterium]|nr:ChpI protein [Acidobacteriota bacterium]
MKTAVSLPDLLFQQAEATARRLRMTRSQLYSTAIAEFLQRQDNDAITQQLNAVYAKQPSQLDPALHRAQVKSIDKDSW